MRVYNPAKAVAIATVAAAAFAMAQSATAKTPAHPTYEQAWQICQHYLDHHSKILRADAGQRYAAGGACMMKYGYRI